MKKFLALILAVVGAMTFSLAGCNQDPILPEDNNQTVIHQQKKEVFIQNIKCAFSPTVTTYSENNQVCLSKTITATVQPESATNKEIDYAVVWQDGADRINEDVKEYVDVVQDSDGSLTATVYCYQPFGDDKITIIATARDGGAKGYCTVTYLGIASEMKITSSTLQLSNNEERGDYYELITNGSFDFNVELSNVFGETNYSNLTYEVKGYGAMTVGQVIPGWNPLLHDYQQAHAEYYLMLNNSYVGGTEFYPIDKYVSSSLSDNKISILTNNNGFTPGTYVDFYNRNAVGGAEWSDGQYAVIPAYDSEVVEEFASRVGLQLQTSDVFSLTGGQGYSFYNFSNSILGGDYGDLTGSHNPNGATFEQYVDEPGAWMIEFYQSSYVQGQLLNSYYFEITVSDSISGISTSVKFVINTAPNDIQLPNLDF